MLHLIQATISIPDSAGLAVNVRHDPDLHPGVPVLEPGMAVPVEDFLDWLERQEGKYEYDRGTVGMMVRVTQNHAEVVWRFVMLLSQQIDTSRYQVFFESFAVQTEASVRFPDVLVKPRGDDGGLLEASDPVLIVEVLSPSSGHLDTVVKRDEYLALPTLKAYVIARQDAPDLTVWRRGTDGRFPEAAEQITGSKNKLLLPELGASLLLQDLYSGVR